ncbi:hypothetical protein [Streptomyces sp. MS2.AVA.5]|uniref:Uncharacterized protein n=1 Tax=Streptomyces achmelvichensis TaxID=3134111 RepID=A0ACC6PL82_9ACTN
MEGTPSAVPVLPLSPLVPGSRSLRAILPESYRQGDFADRFLAGFDDVLSPLITVLDCLDAYFSPSTSPDDFVAWMLEWTNTSLPACVGSTGRRNALLLGHRLHGLRGTAAGLELLIRHVLGGRVDLTESGGTHISPQPGAAGTTATPAESWAHVRVLLPHGMSAGRTNVADDVEDLVQEWIPAHVSATVIVEDQEDPLLGQSPVGERY